MGKKGDSLGRAAGSSAINRKSSKAGVGPRVKFGRPIEEVVEAELGRPLSEVYALVESGEMPSSVLVPKVVKECVTWLEEHEGYKSEGLFRISGKQTVIDMMKAAYDTEGEMNWTMPSVETHCVSSLLKLYLRELPEPLFIFRYYSTFLKVSQNPDVKMRLTNVRKLLMGLPKLNSTTALFVIEFLARVAQHEDVNKMGSTNLATIFAPNILRSEGEEDPMQLMNDSAKIHGIVRLMIDEIDFLAYRSAAPSSLTHSSIQRVEMRSIGIDEAKQLLGRTNSSHSPVDDDDQ